MEKGFNRSGFMAYMEQEFHMENCMLRGIVENLIEEFVEKLTA